MKKQAIISTVGTSLFANYIEWSENDIKNRQSINKELKAIETLAAAAEYSFSQKQAFDSIKASVENWLNSDSEKKDYSAEISSIKKFVEEKNLSKDDFQLYFIATDTALSKLAMELIMNYFKEKFGTKDVVSGKVAEGLRLNNKDAYESEGFNNLLRIIDEIKMQGNERLVFNISGGYKGIIPYMTIYAQLIKANIFYLYEDASDIIEIPNLPMSLKINYCMEKTSAAQIEDFAQRNKAFAKIDYKYNLRPSNKEIIPISRMFNKEIAEFSLNSFIGVLVESVLTSVLPKCLHKDISHYTNQGTEMIYSEDERLLSDIDCKLVHGNKIAIVESKPITIVSKMRNEYGNLGNLTVRQIPTQIDYYVNLRKEVTHYILILWETIPRKLNDDKLNELKTLFSGKYPSVQLIIKKIGIPIGDSVAATVQKIMNLKGNVDESNFIDIN